MSLRLAFPIFALVKLYLDTIMKKTILCVAACTLFSFNVLAQGNQQTLKFDENGKFKIVQFTDLHIRWEDKRSDIAFECMKNTLEAEKPDLVVVTGDIIYSAPADKNFKHVMEFLSKFKIPFAIAFGNHDRQQGLTNAELLKIAQQVPYCVSGDAEGVSGDGNCALEIKGHKDGKNKAIVYIIDSNEDSQLKDRGVGGYDYIHRDQIDWYVNTSRTYTKENGNEPLPSLAFFHIPLPEYNMAATNENVTLYGIRREKACSPEINTGLFAAMKEQGDIMGVFVGHDHDNDYAVNWYNVLLAYGRFTGGPTEYIHIPNGARVIELTEGKRIINSYIRLTDGQIEQKKEFPKDYVK